MLNESVVRHAVEYEEESKFPSLKLIKRGKVRDIWEVDDNHLLIYTTDRVSVFDSILPTTIPGRGELLTVATRYWCNKTKWIISNHISQSQITLDQVLPNADERPNACKACQIVRKYKPLHIEAIVRGYLYGNAWVEYNTMPDNHLPKNMQKAQSFRSVDCSPIFTPTTKAPAGEHDRPMSKEEFFDVLGGNIAQKIVDISIYLYEFAAYHLLKKGFILADTKFEFALDDDTGELVLIDEVITPDNSRIWSKDLYKPGQNQKSYDKDIIREYVSSYIANHPDEVVDISKISLPQEVVNLTYSRYYEFIKTLTNEV
jgi:phosphoribosylaminoimidazole-succinocarboxamide synthase